jgi:hypothetical protein
VKLLRPADVVVLVLGAAVVGAAWASLWPTGGAAESVHVTRPGGPPLELALDTDRRIDVQGSRGISTLEVRDRRVRFVDSPCNGRYCVHAGWLDAAGQVAACLPNGVVAEVRGSDRRFDAVSF